MPSYEYDVAISYAGEDRPFAEELARAMQSRGVGVFYDKHEQAALWGRSLTAQLTEVYEKKAQFCLMLISRHYVEKAYTNLEREAAQARALYDRSYILPVRLDDSEVPGMVHTVACLVVPPETPDSVASAVLLRTGGQNPLSMLDAEGRAEIQAIMQDPKLGPMDRVMFAGLRFGAAIDRRREPLIADLDRLSQRGTDRMSLREELMEAKERTYTGVGDEGIRAIYQDRINALKPEMERDALERVELMAQLDRLQEARQWSLDQMKDMLHRSSETIAKLLAQ